MNLTVKTKDILKATATKLAIAAIAVPLTLTATSALARDNASSGQDSTGQQDSTCGGCSTGGGTPETPSGGGGSGDNDNTCPTYHAKMHGYDNWGGKVTLFGTSDNDKIYGSDGIAFGWIDLDKHTRPTDTHAYYERNGKKDTENCRIHAGDRFSDHAGFKAKFGFRLAASALRQINNTSQNVAATVRRTVNTTMTTVKACLSNATLKEWRAQLKRQTPKEIVVRNYLRDAVNYSFTQDQIDQLQDCSYAGVSRPDNKLCVSNDFSALEAFAEGAACEASFVEPTVVVVPTPAPAPVAEVAPAQNTSSCAPFIADQDILVKYMTGGEIKTADIIAGNFGGIKCDGKLAASATFNTVSVAELMAKGDNGQYMHLVIGATVTPVAANNDNGGSCQPTIAQMCKGAGFTTPKQQ